MTELLGKRSNGPALKDKTTKKIKDKTLSDPELATTETVTKKKAKNPAPEVNNETTETNNINIKVTEKPKNAGGKSKEGPKKIHLPPDEIEKRISELQKRVDELEGPENANKRKRVYQKLIQFKKALGNIEGIVVDPTEKLKKKEEDREKRVQKKIEKSKEDKAVPLSQKKKHSYCIICKEKGHYAETCRQAKAKTHVKELEKHICFNCGNSDHALKDCKEPRGKVLAYATCFFCKEKGHLSRDCPQNEVGIYHKGGSCFECGSVRHLAKECPVRWGTQAAAAEYESTHKNTDFHKTKKEKLPQADDDYAEDVADENDIFSDNDDA